MKAALILAASLTPCAWCAGQDTDVEVLIAQKNQAVQEQIAKVYASLHQPGGIDTGSNVEAFRQLQELKDVAPDQSELVRQLAIFAVTPGDEQQPLAAVVILGWLRIPPKVTIRVLAPYLDTDDPTLHSFLYDIFHGLDRAGSGPFKSVNYYDYLEYVRGQMNRKEEIPGPFIKYIYERSPAQALAVFRHATVNVSEYLQLLNRSVEARQQGGVPTEEERQEIRRIQAEREQDGKERREILLAEHIISNALWLKKRGFDERFHQALPEAMEELKRLAKSKHWWARMYVVYIMRQNLVLRYDLTLRQLAEDGNQLVREAARFEKR
jgi:hypothetical protein